MDMFTPTRRSEIMRAIKGTDTAPEVLVRRLLHSCGCRFRLRRQDLPGKPDIVLPKHHAVVFVHGCFWHGHDCKKGSANRQPKSNEAYWAQKLARNRLRDARIAAEYETLDWKRIVVWACEVKTPDVLRQRLLRELNIERSP